MNCSYSKGGRLFSLPRAFYPSYLSLFIGLFSFSNLQLVRIKYDRERSVIHKLNRHVRSE